MSGAKRYITTIPDGWYFCSSGSRCFPDCYFVFGIEYVSPEKQAARELAAQERIAEEKRIEELKAKCEKNSLSFETEEAKYQEKLDERKEKEAKKN